MSEEQANLFGEFDQEPSKRTEARRRAKGLCAACGKVKSDSWHCDECRRKKRPSWKKRSQKARDERCASGLCQACGKNESKSGYCDQCKQYFRDYTKEWSRKLREERRAKGLCAKCGQRKSKTLWCEPCKQKARIDGNARHHNLRDEAFAAYGWRCFCCGETEPKFLSIDHIEGGGGKHRKSIPGGNMYRWLKKNGYPSTMRLCCMNCNYALGITGNGICPHARARDFAPEYMI